MHQPFQRPVLRYRAAAVASGMVDGYDNVRQTQDGGSGCTQSRRTRPARRHSAAMLSSSADFLQAQCPGNKLKYLVWAFQKLSLMPPIVETRPR